MDVQKAVLFGRGYIFDSMLWTLKEERRRTAVEVYIAESLRLIPQSRYLSKGLAETLNSFDNEPRRTRTAKEIVADVMDKAGLTYGDRRIRTTGEAGA